MLVITGTGRSGTTIIAQWLDELGKLPYESKVLEQFRSGMHPEDVRRLNSAIWIGNDPAMQSIPAQTAAIKSFDYPIIKDSMFFYGNVLDTWLSIRRDLKFFICLRNFSHVEKSRKNFKQISKVRTPQELTDDLGRFMKLVIFSKLPFEIVTFPDFADTENKNNYKEVYEKIMRLEPSLKIDYKKGEKAWKKVIKQNWVDHY